MILSILAIVQSAMTSTIQASVIENTHLLASLPCYFVVHTTVTKGDEVALEYWTRLGIGEEYYGNPDAVARDYLRLAKMSSEEFGLMVDAASLLVSEAPPPPGAMFPERPKREISNDRKELVIEISRKMRIASFDAIEHRLVTLYWLMFMPEETEQFKKRTPGRTNPWKIVDGRWKLMPDGRANGFSATGTYHWIDIPDTARLLLMKRRLVWSSPDR